MCDEALESKEIPTVEEPKPVVTLESISLNVDGTIVNITLEDFLAAGVTERSWVIRRLVEQEDVLKVALYKVLKG